MVAISELGLTLHKLLHAAEKFSTGVRWWGSEIETTCQILFNEVFLFNWVFVEVVVYVPWRTSNWQEGARVAGWALLGCPPWNILCCPPCCWHQCSHRGFTWSSDGRECHQSPDIHLLALFKLKPNYLLRFCYWHLFVASTLHLFPMAFPYPVVLASPIHPDVLRTPFSETKDQSCLYIVKFSSPPVPFLMKTQKSLYWDQFHLMEHNQENKLL